MIYVQKVLDRLKNFLDLTNNKIFFVFLFRNFKMSLGVRQALKVYSGILGLFVSLFAFIWVFFMVYLVSDTPESEHDLRMARYLDICFGLLAFFSSLALMYGAFVESKTWISAWTLGSGTVVVGMWAWYFHRKFSQTPHPEGLYFNFSLFFKIIRPVLLVRHRNKCPFLVINITYLLFKELAIIIFSASSH